MHLSQSGVMSIAVVKDLVCEKVSNLVSLLNNVNAKCLLHDCLAI
jgi:hypothetical protein